MRRRTSIAGILIALLAVAGCGGGGSSTSTTSSSAAPAATSSSSSTAAGGYGAQSSGSTSASAPAASSGGTVKLAADPGGALKFDTTSLSVKAGKVTIDFTNNSSLGHNVTIASGAGAVLGATPTFQGGSKTVTLNLKPGTYTFYCSVPGHRQGGMQGTLVVK